MYHKYSTRGYRLAAVCSTYVDKLIYIVNDKIRPILHRKPYWISNRENNYHCVQDTGQSALFLAAKEGYSDVVELLSDDNPDLISEKDKVGTI